MTTILSVNSVSKKYRIFKDPIDRVIEAFHPFGKSYHTDFWALNDISFELQAGKSIGIIGCNGSGKSTLLELIAGVSKATKGEVITSGRVSALLELGAGFNPEYTGRQNVLLYGVVIGCSESEMEKRISDIEDFASIGDFFDLPIKTYSSGMYARLAFATAISVEPELLIIDEILAVGDARFQEKCFNKLNFMKEAGVSFIMVSHNVEQILKSCDTVLYLQNGVARFLGEPIEAVARYHEQLFGRDRSTKSSSSLDSSVVIAQNKSSCDRLPLIVSECFESKTPSFINKPYYNTNERRIGSGGAEIIDFVMLVDNSVNFVILKGIEQVSIFLKVRFSEDIHSPIIGLGITSNDGFMLSGTNTYLASEKLPKGSNGDVRFYRISFTMNLNTGDYFINLGFTKFSDNNEVMVDVRRAVIHLQVNRNSSCSGFFSTNFELVDLSSEK